MLQYYVNVLRDLPRIAREARGNWGVWGVVIVAVILYFRPELQTVISTPDVARLWAAVPIVLLIVWGLLRANFEQFKRLQDRLATYEGENNLQRAIAQLANLRATGINTLYADSPKSDAELADWKTREDAWFDSVVAVLASNFNEAIVLDFSHLGELAPKVFNHRYNDDHNHQLTMLAHRLQILRQLINKHAQLAPVKD